MGGVVAEQDNPVIVGDEGREVWLRGEGKRVRIISPLYVIQVWQRSQIYILSDFCRFQFYIYKEKEEAGSTGVSEFGKCRISIAS